MYVIKSPFFFVNFTGWFNTNLIRWRVQAKEVTVALLQPCLSIAMVHVLCSCSLQHRQEQSIWGGVLQVKDAGGPTPPRSLIEAY